MQILVSPTTTTYRLPRRHAGSSAGEVAPAPAPTEAAWAVVAVGSLATIGTKFNAVSTIVVCIVYWPSSGQKDKRTGVVQLMSACVSL